MPHADPEERRRYQREYARRPAIRARHRETMRQWRAGNRDHCNAYAREWQRKKKIAAIRAKPAEERTRSEKRQLAEANIALGYRYCWWCQEAHPIGEFGPYKGGRDGIDCNCRAARREMKRIYDARRRRKDPKPCDPDGSETTAA